MTMRQCLIFPLKHDEIVMAYQPQIDMRSGAILAKEALLRPSKAIVEAERTGVLRLLGRHIISAVLMQIRKWHDASVSPVKTFINVSPSQLHYEFVDEVAALLETYSLDSSVIGIEITEEFDIAHCTTEMLETLSALKNVGIELAIDDFGMGKTSLHLLEDGIFDKIKIDRKFLDSMHKNNIQKVLQMMSELAEALNMSLVAEGIETQQQQETLLKAGIYIGQGFYLGSPMAPDAFYARQPALSVVEKD